MPAAIGIDAEININTRKALQDVSNFAREAERTLSSSLGNATRSAVQFQKSLDSAFSRVTTFAAATSIIYGLGRAFDALTASTIGVEKKLTDINVIMNLSSANLARFRGDLLNVAKDTGQSFDTVSEAAIELSRQGLGAEETLKRVKDGMILVRLTGLSASEAISDLTAAVNSFSKSALTTNEVVNKLATVDAAFAVSSNDLAEALRRVGSTAQDTGVSFDSLIALVTSAQQVTARGGAVIANGLKSIFQRIQRPETLDYLRQLGVEVFNLQGGVQDADKVLLSLARTYDTLNDAQKNQVVQLSAGVFQANVFRAILSDLARQNSIYSASLKVSSDATSEANDRNEKLNQTLSALVNKTKVNLVDVSSQIGSITFDRPIRALLDGLNEILDGFDHLKDSFSGGVLQSTLEGLGKFLSGPGLVGGLVAGGTVLFKVFSQAASYIGESAQALFNINKAENESLKLQLQINNVIAESPQLLNDIIGKRLTQYEIEEQILKALQAQAAVQGTLAEVNAATAGSFLSGGASKITTRGAIPAFSPLYDAISRESAAGIPGSAIRVGSSSILQTGSNPQGLGIYNTIDEPGGLSQGIGRRMSKSINPASGGIPNFSNFNYEGQFQSYLGQSFKYGQENEIIPPQSTPLKTAAAIARGLYPRYGSSASGSLKSSADIAMEKAEKIREETAQEELALAQEEAARLREREVLQKSVADRQNTILKAQERSIAARQLVSDYYSGVAQNEYRVSTAERMSSAQAFAAARSGRAGIASGIESQMLAGFQSNMRYLGTTEGGMQGLSYTKQPSSPGLFSLSGANLGRLAIGGSILAPIASSAIQDTIDQTSKSGRLRAGLVGDLGSALSNGFGVGIGAGYASGGNPYVGLGAGGAALGYGLYKAYNNYQTGLQDNSPEANALFKNAQEKANESNDLLSQFQAVNNQISGARTGEIKVSPKKLLEFQKQRQGLLNKISGFDSSGPLIAAISSGDEDQQSQAFESFRRENVSNVKSAGFLSDLAGYQTKDFAGPDSPYELRQSNINKFTDSFLGLGQKESLGEKLYNDPTFREKISDALIGERTLSPSFFGTLVGATDLGDKQKSQLTQGYSLSQGQKFGDEVSQSLAFGLRKYILETIPKIQANTDILNGGEKKQAVSFNAYGKYLYDLINNIKESSRKIELDSQTGILVQQRQNKIYSLQSQTEINRATGVQSPLSVLDLEGKKQVQDFGYPLNIQSAQGIEKLRKETNELLLNPLEGLKKNLAQSFGIDNSFVTQLKPLQEGVGGIFKPLETFSGNSSGDRFGIGSLQETLKNLKEQVQPFIGTDFNGKNPNGIPIPQNLREPLNSGLEKLIDSYEEEINKRRLLSASYEQNKILVDKETKQRKDDLIYQNTRKADVEYAAGRLFSSDYASQKIQNNNYKILNPEVAGQYNVIGDSLSSFSNQLKYTIKDVYKDLNEGAAQVGQSLKSSFGGALKEFAAGTVSATQALRNFGLSFAQSILNKTIDMGTSSLFGGISSGVGAAFSSVFSSSAGHSTGGLIRGYAGGGMVTGGSGTVDDIPAMLGGGEYVMRKSAVNKYGAGLFSMMNSGGLARFASGGSASINLNNRFNYNNALTPTAGTNVIDSNLSNFALSDENSLQNVLRMSREGTLQQYLKDKSDYNAANAITLANFKQGQKQALIGAYISAAAGIAGAGLGSAFKGYTATSAANSANAQPGFNWNSSGSNPNQASGFDDSDIYGVYHRAAGGLMRGMAMGGAWGSDRIPALLTGGEYVLNRQAVDRHGVDFLNRLNSGQVGVRAATGGLISASGGTDSSDSSDKLNDSILQLIKVTDALNQNINKNNSQNQSLGKPAQSGQNPGQTATPVQITNTFNFSVSSNGVKSDDSKQNSQNSQTAGDKQTDQKQLGQQLQSAIMAVIIKDTRPGGYLYSFVKNN